jgi:hypothetical protein
LLKASLSFVQFPLDNNIFKAVQLNYSWEFYVVFLR